MGWDEAQVGSRRLGRSLDQLGRSGTLPLGPPTLLTHIHWSSRTFGWKHRCFLLHYFVLLLSHLLSDVVCVNHCQHQLFNVVMLCLRVVDILTLIVYVCRLIKQFIGS